jgi:cold shock CspA family protein
MRGKGFGFINLPSGDQLFCHTSQLRNCDNMDLLRDGDMLAFRIGTDPKNPAKKQATDVYVKTDISTRAPLAWQPQSSVRGRGRGSGRDRGRGRGGFGRQQQRQQYSPYDQPAYGQPQGGNYQYDPYSSQSNYGYQQDYQGYGHQQNYGSQNHYEPPQSRSGNISKLSSGFGFVSSMGEEFFFPGRSVLENQFGNLKVGDAVTFAVGPDPRGREQMIALEVRMASGEGVVEKLMPKGFAFLKSDKGESLFFHARHLQGASFEEVKVGSRMQFVASPSQNKPGSFEAQQLKLL